MERKRTSACSLIAAVAAALAADELIKYIAVALIKLNEFASQRVQDNFSAA